MKILKIFGKLDPGGAEMRTMELINEIERRGRKQLEFHILVLSGESGTLDKKFIEKNVLIHYIKLKEIKFIFKFIKLMKREKFTVIYSNVFLFSGFFMLLGYILKVPVRVSHIRTLFDEKKGKLREARNYILKFFIRKFSTKIIGVNNSVLENNFGQEYLSNKKFQVLYNGINFNPDFKKNQQVEETYNIVHIGRQIQAKNHKKVIEVFVEILKLLPNTKLHLIGKLDKNIKTEIDLIIEQNNIKQNIFFWGVQENIHKVFDNKNLLIFPSKREGLPGVVLESLAYGVPVLASNIAPHVELTKYFSELHLLGVEEPNKLWAKKAVFLILKNPLINSAKITNEYSVSPFTIKQHTDTYLKIINSK